MKYIFFALIIIFISAISTLSQQPTQVIRGVVVDENINLPLPGATVKLTSTDPIKGAITDRNGNFKIKDVPVGRHEIKVTYVSYEEKTIPNILVISGKELVLEIKLEEKLVETKEVVVKGIKDITVANNDVVVSSVSNLRPEAINRFAGTRGDPSKMAASTAGVAGDNSQRNDIIVRGNSSLGVLWRCEDVDIPNPNHFTVAGTGGGIFSIINNNALSNSDFMTGAFPSEYGNKTAAVFDIQLRNGNNEQHEYTFQVGLNGIEFGAEGPFSSDSRASYLANFRFVSLEPVRALGVDLSANVFPEYMDGNFKINVPTSDAGRFTLWGIAGRSTASVINSEDDVIWTPQTRIEDENINSKMYALGLSHTYLFSKNTFGKLSVSTSGSSINTHNDFVYQDESKNKEAEEYDGIEGWHLIKYTLSHKLSQRHLLKAGIEYRNMFFDNFFYEWEDGLDTYLTKMDEKGDANLYQAYGHWQFRITENLQTNVGLHYQLFTLNDSYAIEPRLSINYKLTDKQSVNASYGKHSQSHPLLYYFFLYGLDESEKGRKPNYNLDFTRSDHYVIGYKNRIFNDFFVKADVYYQDMYDVPISLRQNSGYYSFVNLGAEFSFDPEDSTYNLGSARNYGIELTFNKDFSHGYYFLVTASIFRSLYTGADNIERSSAFDLGHAVNLLGGFEWQLDDNNEYVLSFDCKATHIGGRHIISIDKEKSIENGYETRDTENAYKHTLNDYFSFDIKITLNINLESTTHNIFIAADNVFNRQNQVEQEWDNKNKEIFYEHQLGLFPYLGYRINF